MVNLSSYIKSGYSILYLLTHEESRAELLILNSANELKRSLKVWSCTEGFSNPNNKYNDATYDPKTALEKIKSDTTTQIYVMRDMHSFFTSPIIIRTLRDIAKEFKQQGKTLIIISPVKKIPVELEKDITVIEFDLPDRDNLSLVFNNLYESNVKAGKEKLKTMDISEKDGFEKYIKKLSSITNDERERIIHASMGLTIIEAENAFAKAIIDSKNSETSISKLVMIEKALAVKKSGILEYFDAKQTTNDIGGLDNLKKWLKIRSKAFSKEARDFGLPMPRGILLAGLPGCGKSLTAKVASNIFGVPLIRFDIGKVFAGLVGQSEENMRTAIQTAEAVGACVLWIDEMEKAFSGMSGSGTTDGGTSQRVFGNFITWMQEKTSPVFIISTVNRISTLPPELLRKGRFDEIFFVGLPSFKEREDILKIHVNKYGRDANKFKLEKAAQSSVGYSGAELEEAVISGLFNAFDKGKELSDKDIIDAIKVTSPLSVTNSADLDYMIRWATDNKVVNASSVNGEEKLHAGRQLDL